MSIPVDLRQIQIKNFKQEVNQTLSYGDVLYFQGKSVITDIHGANNEDGTQNVTYIAKCQLCEVKKAPDEVTPPVSIADDKRIKEKSLSQGLKQHAFRAYQDTGISEDGIYKIAIEAGHKAINEIVDKHMGLNE